MRYARFMLWGMTDLQRPHRSLASILSERNFEYLAILGALSQFYVLLVFSVNRFRHFDTGVDYAIFNQATYLIGHGKFSPFDTIYNDRFLLDQFNILAWPLAALRDIFPSSLTLLVVQAVAISLTSYVVVRFAIKVAFRGSDSIFLHIGAVGLSAVSVFASPWAFEADFFDFHMEPILALTLAVSLYSFYFRKDGFGYLAAALTLMAAGVAAVYVASMGLGMVAIRGLRRQGATLMVMGFLWFLLIILLNAHQGTSLDATYGYLAHGSSPNPTLMAILLGVVTHPLQAVSVLNARRGPIAQIFEFSGLFGVGYPPAFVPAIVAVLVNGLPSSSAFIALSQGFQNYPEVVLLSMGTAVVLVRFVPKLVRKFFTSVNTQTTYSVVGAFSLIVAVVLFFVQLPIDLGIPPSWLRTSVSIANVLRSYSPGHKKEVIATMNVVGRYASRRSIYAWFGDPQSFPICTPQQIVVLVGNAVTSPLNRGVVVMEAKLLEGMGGAKLIRKGPQTWIFETSFRLGHAVKLPGNKVVSMSPSVSCHNE